MPDAGATADAGAMPDADAIPDDGAEGDPDDGARAGGGPGVSGAVADPPPGMDPTQNPTRDGFRRRLPPRLAAWIAAGAWRRPRWVIGGLAAVLLIGVALGLAVPRAPSVALALLPGEDARREHVLATASFDPGSLILLARSQGALLWYATQGDGAFASVVVDTEEIPAQRNCVPREATGGQPLSVSSQSRPVADGTVSGDNGIVFLTATGVPVGFLQHWSTTVTADRGLTARELASLRRITAEYRLRNVTVVGRVEGAPVWVGSRDGGDSCLVVETTILHAICGTPRFASADAEQKPALTLELPAEPGREASRLDYWMGASSYLVITEGSPTGAGSTFGPAPAS